MPKGIPNKRYTGEFKQIVVETMMQEKLSYREAARQFEISDDNRVAAWERIYLGKSCSAFLNQKCIPPGGLRGVSKYDRIWKVYRRESAMMQEHSKHNGVTLSHDHVHENQRAIVNRLSRALGHLEKVRQMVEDGADCTEVLVQLSAVRSALDNAGKVILKDHLRHCIVDAVSDGDDDVIDNLCTAIDKFMK